MSGLVPVLEVALGVGFLILFHEFGHYVFARLAGVRVDTFSLGFGPRIFGWRRGPTDYRISAVPFGGYVKLAGELPSAGGTGAPDELSSKGAGWRAAIFLAGIAFNLLFAILLFPVLFAVGVPFVEPVVGETVAGGPAWSAGIEPGTRILSIEGTRIYSFEQIRSVVALADAGESEPLRVRVRAPSGEESDVELLPSWDRENGFRVFQILPAPDPEGRIEVDEETPAARAGLRSGDRLLAVNGFEGADLYLEFDLASARGLPLRLRFLESAAGGDPEAPAPPSGGVVREETLTPVRKEAKGHQLGIAPLLDRVKAVRAPLLGLGIRPGDRLLSIDGKPALDESDRRRPVAAPGGRVALAFEREDGSRYEVVRDVPGARERRAVLDALAFEVDGTRVVPVPDLPAEKAGVLPGDRIVSIEGRPVERWEEILRAVGRAGASPIRLLLERDGRALDPIVVQPAPRFEFEYGLHQRVASHTFRAGGLGEAWTLGWQATVGHVGDFFLAIRRMAKREMSPRNLSGIVSIVGLSYRFSQISIAKFLFFLAVLSVNLALINVLPIPLLDGGHILFLAIEKLKGRPVSERVLTVAQVAGLVVIGGLVVFVTWNDIQKWFF